MADPYSVLGVSKKASEAEIKKAFRALAKKNISYDIDYYFKMVDQNPQNYQRQ